MICYKCGSQLGSGGLCLRCGADVSIYRKIVHISNGYYNAALEKAKVRNLSGAIRDLTVSLQYDKKNIQARNLLGLCYFETGEIVEALCQWVISKNLKPDDNIAEEYINEIQQDKHALENMYGAIKKYNQALDAAKHDGKDLAIITLKSAVSQNKKLLKAYQLLSLLLIDDGDISKANKVVKQGLSIDKGNIVLLRYIKETKGKVGLAKDKKNKLLESQKVIAAEETVIPGYTDKSRTKNILIGAGAALILCIAAYFTLIKPSLNRNSNNIINQNAISYYEKSEEKDAKIQALSDELTGVKKELEIAIDRLSIYDAEDGTITNYKRLMNVINLYTSEKYEEMVEAFKLINPDVLDGEEALAAYKAIADFIPSNKCMDQFFKRALDSFNSGKYSACREACEVCLSYNENYAPAIYYMGLSFEATGSDSQAAPYFKRIVDEFPSSEYYALARRRVS